MWNVSPNAAYGQHTTESQNARQPSGESENKRGRETVREGRIERERDTDERDSKKETAIKVM